MEEDSVNVNKLSDERRKELLSSRDDYNKLISTQEKDLDNYLLLINGAVFNLILIFVDKIIPLKTASCIWLFYSALVLSAVSVLFVLFSMEISVYQLKQCREKLDLGLKNDDDPYMDIITLINKRKWFAVPNWNYASLFCLLLTLIFISIFVVMNTHYSRVIIL